MGKVWLLAGIAGIAAIAAVFLWYPKAPAPGPRSTALEIDAAVEAPEPTGPLGPIPLEIPLDPIKVALGGKLFHDTKLSGNDTVACVSCHDLEHGGVDGRQVSMGIGGQLGDVNAPTVFNSGFNFAQFWDGRAASLEEQIEGPVHDPRELGSSWPEILGKLQADPDYSASFQKIYAEGPTQENVVDAIATFERSLYTPNSRFDRYLRGDDSALDEQERSGYELFLALGCVACHQGVGIGGNMFQRMGAKNEYFSERGTGTDADLGRYNVTGKEFDRYRFKVPSLRNVAVTAPYFHDGSADTLEEAVEVMARFQLARKLSSGEKDELVAFLKTLTGEYNGQTLTAIETDSVSPEGGGGGL